MRLKVYILPTLNVIFVQAVLNTVSSISNVQSLYQCSCKQCCTIAVYAMCYSLLLIHVDCRSRLPLGVICLFIVA